MAFRALDWWVGHAPAEIAETSGWFVGQFMTGTPGLRSQTEVELKWGCHQKGDRRPAGAGADGIATTISILIRGALLTSLRSGDRQESVLIRTEGDYIIFGPHTVHDWEALEDTLVVSIRFPSVERKSKVASPIQG